MTIDHRILAKLERETGPVILAALEDPSVVEIVYNPDGQLWIERLGEPMRAVEHSLTAGLVTDMLGTIASMVGAVFDAAHPLLEADHPIGGARIQAVRPPASDGPMFAFRRHAGATFSLDDWRARGSLSDRAHAYLKQAVDDRANIVCAGDTGSGKTTFCNAILAAIAVQCPDDRIILIQERNELRVSSPNRAALFATDQITIDRLVRATFRLRPTRTIVGEVRGGEMAALVKLWGGGHPGGCTTLHSRTVEHAPYQLYDYAREAVPHLSPRVLTAGIDVIVFLERVNGPPYRRVSAVHRLAGYEEGQFITQSVEDI